MTTVPTPITDWLGVDPHIALLALTPIFMLFIGIEWLWLRPRRVKMPSARYTLIDTASNITLGGLYQVSDVLAALITVHVYNLLFDWRLFEIDFHAGSFLLLLLLQDFLYYWFHRAHHRIRWFWASHVVHHSSEKLNLSTALRQSVTYPITGMWLFWLPLAWIGFPTEAVLFAVALSLAFQFFVHSQAVPKLGWLELLLNTPSHHRAHHGSNPKYIDKNYGGILIIWDRLFGTFVEEDEAEPVKYGIVEQIQTHNPVTLNFHEWRDMLNEARLPGLSWKQRFWVLAGPPEGRGLANTVAAEENGNLAPMVGLEAKG